jgi:hypothetical protein
VTDVNESFAAMSLARVLNRGTLLGCAAIGALIGAVTLGQQALDGEPVLAATTTDQQARSVVNPARQVARAPSSLPQTSDCGDFAFAFLHSSCSKPHVRHVVRNHRVATTVISHAEAASSSTTTDQKSIAAASVTEVRNPQKAALSTTDQQAPAVNKKPKVVKYNAARTVFGTSGDWFGQQRKQNTAMRSFFE